MSAPAADVDEPLVLVIDDDRGLRDTVSDVLSMHNIGSATCGSAEEALAWCAGREPDVVLVDQRLPDSSGLDLAAKIHRDLPLVPIVLLTGYASEASAIAAIGVVDDYLTKPVQPQELVKVLRARIDQHRLRLANRNLLDQLTASNVRLEQAVEERTAELRLARDDALAATRVMSQFLSSVSHELRTPLNAIIGFSDLMAREPTDGTTSIVPTEWIDYINRSGRRLLALINDLLDLSKSQAGQMVLKCEAVEVVGIIQDAVATLQPVAAGDQKTVSYDAADITVFADPLRLRQVVDNLLSNALKFTPEGGAITVEAGQDEQGPFIAVRDTGVGIAPEDLDVVFEPFRQVGDGSTYRAGTGLGLALTKRLVEQHGGTITVQSELGSGSSFTVRLPAFEPDESPHGGTELAS